MGVLVVCSHLKMCIVCNKKRRIYNSSIISIVVVIQL